jgi:hypothetical protein
MGAMLPPSLHLGGVGMPVSLRHNGLSVVRIRGSSPTSGDARGKMPACDCCQNNHQFDFCCHSMLTHLCL